MDNNYSINVMTRDYLIELAHSIDTYVADAFLKALGVKRVQRKRRNKRHGSR